MIEISRKDFLLYLLIGISVGLLFFSIITTRLYSVGPYGLGLVSALPIAFWIGLGALGLLWLFGTKKNWVLALALILTVGYLFFAPAVIREPVWLSNSYYPFGESALVNSSGHLLDRAWQPLNSYHDWPLFIFLSSLVTQMTVISTTALLKFFPVFIISVCALLAFFILRIRFTIPQALIGVGIFVASFWFRQQYFGPPGIGFLFFLLGLLIVLKLFFTNTSNKKVLAGLFLLVFLGTISTHFLSAVMLLTVAFVLYISQVVFYRKNQLNAVVLLILTTVFFLGYTVFFTPQFFTYLLGVFSSLVSFQGGIAQESARLLGSAAQVLNYRSTLAIIALDCVVPLIAIILIMRSKVSRSKFFGDSFNSFWVVLLVFLVIFALFFQYGPHEGYQRALMFALLPLSYLCVVAALKKPKLLAVVIVSLLFLNIAAQYGADSYTLQTKTDLSGAQFVSEKTSDKIVVLYDFSLLMRYYEPTKNITFRVLEYLPFTYVPNSTDVLGIASDCDYVILSDTSDNFYYYFMQQTPISDALGGSNDSLGFNRVYDSEGFVVFGDR